MSTLPSSSPSADPVSGRPVDPEELRGIGLRAGLHAVGFTHAEPFTEARVTIERHKEAGLAGDMQFTYRNPERSTTPSRILPGAKSIVVGAWPYASPGTTNPADPADPTESAPVGERPWGDVAAYAWRDHYGDLRTALGEVADRLRDSGWNCRVVADDNALVDRAAAVRAGIGWAGKNSNVLLPGRGSWYVLGSIVTDAPLAPDSPIPDRCGPCTRCIDECPTGAIVADGVVDARRCLAWLVQAGGDFPVEFRAALGTRIYGCDDCQIACPPSRRSPTEQLGDEVASWDLVELLEMSDHDLLAAVGRWYIARRDPRYVRRNALVALGNVALGDAVRPAVLAILERYESGADEMLADHAGWARDRHR